MAKRNNIIIILPDDIVLLQILPRLPNKSLGRFMCVCKQWHSFLTSPVFTKIHVSNQKQHKLVVVSSTKPYNYFCTIDCETPEVGLSANRPLPFEVGNNGMSIISSLNGPVCVGIKPLQWHGGCWCRNFLDINLWNPLTCDYKTMSKVNNCFIIAPRACGLYYNSCDDDYKLLGVTQSSGDAYIYSWKSDSWRKAKSRVDSLLEYWAFGCLSNGKLYFLTNERGGNGSEILRSLIISFDTKTEMFTEIATPSSLCWHMRAEGGCIHLFTYDPFELWKLDGDGDWTKVIWRSPKGHLIRDGYRLVHFSGQVYLIKVEGNGSEKVVCQYTVDDTMFFLPNGKFVETIVSPKRIRISSPHSFKNNSDTVLVREVNSIEH